MTRKKRWRYYCDFCSKSGGAAGHLVRHERGCTMNPGRICGFHEAREERQPDMAALVAVFESEGDTWAARLVALREAADNCPACILAGIRQSRKFEAALMEDEYPDPDDVAAVFAGFKFREEVAHFWEEQNASGYASQHAGV